MTDAPRNRRLPLEAIGAATLAVGLVVLAAAVFTPDSWLRGGDYSAADAREHQAASAELHRLALSPDRTEAHLQQLREAREKMGDLEVDRRRAAEAPDRWREAFRWLGGGLCLAGGATVAASRALNG
ncbi:hypothetical protein [Botrimarina sp.]|uniref:hypothetical protein n=1 Tax=Botrimarina sp. TaxID=2795802 RepID=UPI0032EF14AC